MHEVLRGRRKGWAKPSGALSRCICHTVSLPLRDSSGRGGFREGAGCWPCSRGPLLKHGLSQGERFRLGFSRRTRFGGTLGYALEAVAHNAPHSWVPKSLLEGARGERMGEKGRLGEFYRKWLNWAMTLSKMASSPSDG